MGVPLALDPPSIDTTATQRQVGALGEQTLEQFTNIRALGGSTDASFSFGTRASRPSSGAAGDRYFAQNRQTLYVWNGTAWEVVVGFDSGTDATRAAITPDASDNGAFFYTTDTGKLWEVAGGAWVDRFVDIAVTTGFKVGANYVVKARGAAVADVASADATDLPTVITLANETKAQLNLLLARIRAATGHGLIT